MTNKAAEKMIDGLTQFLEGFTELEEGLKEDLQASRDEEIDTEEEGDPELEAAVVSEMRGIIESVLEAEEHSTEYFASLLSAMTEALEELDPDVFEGGASLLEEEDEEEDEEYDDLDDDDDDDDLEFDEDEEEEEEYEDEDEDY